MPTAEIKTKVNDRNHKRSSCDKAGAPFFCQKYVRGIYFPQYKKRDNLDTIQKLCQNYVTRKCLRLKK